MNPKERNPWTRTDTKTIVQNPWFSLRRDSVNHCRSGPGEYWVLEAHPALGVVAVDGEGEITLVGQYRYPLKQWSWELPEGGGASGESLLDTAQRELREETGLQALEWSLLGTIHTSNCFTDEEATIYLAENLEQGATNPDPTEELQLCKVTFEQAMSMLRRGEITDSMTVAGLYFYQDVLQGHRKLQSLPPEDVSQSWQKVSAK